MNDEPNALLRRYLDDRDGLSEAELELLVAALRDSTELRSRMRDQLVIEELVAQQVGVDRRNFPAQVNQRLSDEQDASNVERQVLEMQKLASDEWDRWSDGRQKQRRRNSRRWIASGASLLIAVLAAVFAYREYGPIAHINSVQGELTLIRDQQQIVVESGMALYSGDRLRATSSRFSMDFADRSQLAARGPIELLFTGRRTQAKQLTIERGDITANVIRQPAGAPMLLRTPNADAEVLGTELFLLVDELRTRLDVAHGKVRLDRAEQSTIVETGGFATADTANLSEGRQRWPMNANDLVLSNAFGKSAHVKAHYVDQPVVSPLQPRGDVKWREERLVLNGGAYQIDDRIAEDVLRRCQSANAFTVELWLKAGEGLQPDSARILAFGADGEYNLLLTAAGGALQMQMASTLWDGVQQRPIRLCGDIDQQWHHVIVSYGNSKLACFLDGHLVKTWAWEGDLSPWRSGYLLLGDAWDGDGQMAWAGECGALAIYSRALSSHEAYRNWRVLRDRAQR